MRVLWSLPLPLLGLLSGVRCAEEKPSSQRKLETVREAAFASPFGTVALHDSNFTRYAFSTPRPYHIVVLFTAMAERVQCQVCHNVQPLYAITAMSYKQNRFKRSDEMPLVFAVVDFDNAKGVFEKMGFQTAPHVYLFPADLDVRKVPPQELANYVVTSHAMEGPEALTNEIRARTGVLVPIRKDTSAVKSLCLFVAVAAALLAHFVTQDPAFALQTARSWRLWLLVSIFCYAFGVGGYVYNIIRTPRDYGAVKAPDGSTRIQLFNPGGREQFQYEGGVIALLYLAMAGSLLLCGRAAAWKRVPGVVRSALALLAVTLFLYFFLLFFELYTLKTKWYVLGGGEGVIPAPVASLFTPVKKSHGLLKRLVRLSNVWLNEFTTWRSFADKVQKLLIDWAAKNAREAVANMSSRKWPFAP